LDANEISLYQGFTILSLRSKDQKCIRNLSKSLQNLINTPKLIEKKRKKKEEAILGILL
jgi:CRISPR-associated protein Cas8b1/Cst1 subtype I-B